MIKFELQHPVTIGEGSDVETVRELNLRRAKIKDLRAAKDYSDVDYTAFLIESLSGLPKAVVDEIDGQDYRRLEKEIGSFLGIGQETGSGG